MATSIVALNDLSRLFAVFRKAQRKETIRVAAIGGSITAGAGASSESNRWLNRSAAWFDNRYGASGAARIVNAGIGSTESDYGALRVRRDVLSFEPDLVFVDYAVNNSPSDIESYDDLLRILITANPAVCILPIMFCNSIGQGQQDNLVPYCNTYNLPIISYRDPLVALLAAGALPTDYSDDFVHPNDAGHFLAGTCVWDFLDKAKAYFDARAAFMPDPLPNVDFQNVAFITREALISNVQSPSFTYSAGALTTSTATAFVEYTINVGGPGDVYLIAREQADTGLGVINTFIDDAPFDSHDWYNAAITYGPKAETRRVATGVSAGQHRVRFIVSNGAGGGAKADLYGVGWTI